MKTMSQQKIGKVWNFSRTWQVVYFLPLSLLLLERLWFQFETIGASSSYFNLETTAATRKQKNPRSSGTVELPTLTQLTTSASDWISCPANTEMIMNTNGESDSSSNENIPMVIHQTARSRCLTPIFREASSKWKLPGFEYRFHNDKAVNRLLGLDFPEFPQLRNILRNCVTNRKAKTILWKYLVLYFYGGVFSDFGSIPKNFSADTIETDDDGIFVLQNSHDNFLSQSFIAVSPRHPIIYFTIQHYILSILNLKNIQEANYEGMSFRALQKSLHSFRNNTGEPILSGKFTGIGDRSIRVIGEEKFMIDDSTIDPSIKLKDYTTMGMTGELFKSSQNSCMSTILKDVNSALLTV